MHSCETAVCKMLNVCRLIVANVGYVTGIIRLKCRIWHNIGHSILLNRLCTRFGITGSPLAWLGVATFHRATINRNDR